MLQNLPSQVLQSSMSRRSAEIEMDTIQHVALSGDQQPGVRCCPVAAVAELVSSATIRYAFEIRRLDVEAARLQIDCSQWRPSICAEHDKLWQAAGYCILFRRV